jgi:hypothetical protein
VAAMLGVEPKTDPVDLAEVGDCLGANSFVHFAMASPMWPTPTRPGSGSARGTRTA